MIHKRVAGGTANLQRSLLVFFSGVLLCSSVISAFGVTNSVDAAITYAQAKECYDKFNGKTVAIGEYDTNCNQVCTATFSTDPLVDLDNPNPTAAYKITCIDVYANRALQDATASIVTNIYFTALADEFCQLGTPSANSECRSILKAQVTTCMNAFYENGYDGGSSFVFPDIDIPVVASCIASKRTEPARTIANIMNSVEAEAREQGGIVQADVVAQQLQDTCEDSGGTYTADGTCQQEVRQNCKIDGVGWIICPAATFIAMLNDSLYSIIERFLVVDSRMFSTSPSDGANAETYSIWQQVRNLANALFIVAFLVIIYSQMVGGSKK